MRIALVGPSYSTSRSLTNFLCISLGLGRSLSASVAFTDQSRSFYKTYGVFAACPSWSLRLYLTQHRETHQVTFVLSLRDAYLCYVRHAALCHDHASVCMSALPEHQPHLRGPSASAAFMVVAQLTEVTATNSHRHTHSRCRHPAPKLCRPHRVFRRTTTPRPRPHSHPRSALQATQSSIFSPFLPCSCTPRPTDVRRPAGPAPAGGSVVGIWKYRI